MEEFPPPLTCSTVPTVPASGHALIGDRPYRSSQFSLASCHFYRQFSNWSYHSLWYHWSIRSPPGLYQVLLPPLTSPMQKGSGFSPALSAVL